MSFIDDENFIAIPRRRIAGVLSQFAHGVDTAVRCGIDFDHINGTSRDNFAAGITFAAGLRRWSAMAVQRFRKQTRNGGFAHSALPREDITVTRAIQANGILQGLSYVLLPNHFRKFLGPPRACNNLIQDVFFAESRTAFLPEMVCKRNRLRLSIGQTSGDSVAHKRSFYRCFLPDLAGFVGFCCTEPEA